MMDYAVEHGISVFDTASAYGGGRSEIIVGQWRKARAGAGEAPTVATKILPPYDRPSINLAVEKSLARLGVGGLDVLFLHRWEDSLLQDEPYAALEEWVSQGVVRELGLSNVSETQLGHALATQRRLGAARFRWVQNNHNLAVRGFDGGLQKLCRSEGMTMVGYSPLGAGFLTGKHRGGVQTGTRFDVIPGHQAVYFNEQAQNRLSRLDLVAARTGRTNVELALAWALHQSIDLVLVGGRTTDHLAQAFRARELNDPAILEQLSEI